MSERVCIRCGWFAFDRERCPRDGGPTISWRAAARACGVETLRALLGISPTVRVLHFKRHRAMPGRDEGSVIMRGKGRAGVATHSGGQARAP